MKVADLMLSDYATVNDKGKYTLVGAGFTEILTKKVPFRYPLMFIFIRLRITSKDIGRNRIRVQIVGEKGAIFKADINIDIAKNHTGVRFIPIPTQISNLRFPNVGSYDIEVCINGELKECQSLRIILKNN
ncbi:MAG: hypothetical protein K8S27_09960 [Candidatus Omnitrophica bacterium]|nr:hypothetical protein [Candidatus Omnitrophota bacterium]